MASIWPAFCSIFRHSEEHLATVRGLRSHHRYGPIPSRLGAILGLVLAEEFSMLLTYYRPLRGSEDEYYPVTNQDLKDPPVRSICRPEAVPSSTTHSTATRSGTYRLLHTKYKGHRKSEIPVKTCFKPPIRVSLMLSLSLSICMKGRAQFQTHSPNRFALSYQTWRWYPVQKRSHETQVENTIQLPFLTHSRPPLQCIS